MGIRPEFADIAINYTNPTDFAINVVSQAEFIFSEMDAATPLFTESNGGKTVDPTPIVDLSAFIPSLDPCSVTDGRFGSSNGMGFACSDIMVPSCGFYQRVEIDISESFDITLILSHPLGSEDGYYCKISSSTSKLSFGINSADGSTQTEIRSLFVDTSLVDTTKDLLFQTDGSGRFKCTWGSYEILLSDLTNSIYDIDFGYVATIIVYGLVSNYDLGAAQGFNIPDKGDYSTINNIPNIIPTAIDRGISYNNISLSGNMWIEGYNLNSTYTSSAFDDAILDTFASKSSNSISADSGPLVMLEKNYPGSIPSTSDTIRAGFTSIFSDSSKINSIATQNIGLQNFLVELDPGATPILPYDISDINTLAQDSIDDGTVPGLVFFINDWQEGSVESLDPDFNDIITNLDSVTGPCWVFLAPSPSAFFDGTHTVDGWFDIQERFKFVLDDSGNDNIAFCCALDFANFSSEDFPSDRFRGWDAVSCGIVISGTADSTSASLSLIRQWVTDNYSKLILSISVDFSGATPPLSTDVIDWFDSFYENCRNADTDVALIYAENSSEYVIPDPSDELDDWAALVSDTHSLTASEGGQTRVANIKIEESFIETYANLIGTLSTYYSASRVFVWDDLNGYRSAPSHDIAGYKTFFNEVADVVNNFPGTQVYGPNIELAARSAGYDSSYNGVTIDSRDINALQSFINDVEAATPTVFADGIAIKGNFTAAQWPDVIEYVKTLTSLPLAVTEIANIDAEKFEAVLNALDPIDTVHTNSTIFLNPDIFEFTGTTWSYSATLVVPATINNCKIQVTYSDDILYNGFIDVSKSGATPYSLTKELPLSGDYILLGTLTSGTYDIDISGDIIKEGSATLRVWFDGDGVGERAISDTKYIGG